jgi:hypothetical protein
MLKHRSPFNAAIGAAFAIAALHGVTSKRAKVAPKKPRELTEVEKWNAEVEARKATKKAKRAASKETK